LNYLIILLDFLNGDWGLGIGDWGLGIGDWAQSPIPNPQSPIPNPHDKLLNSFKCELNIYLILYYKIIIFINFITNYSYYKNN